MIILSLNTGSSTLKYKLIDTGTELELAAGNVPVRGAGEIREAVGKMFEALPPHVLPDAVGHRVVQGGDLFRQTTVVTGEVEAALATLHPLAPLHSPVNLAGIHAARELRPGLPHVAVFDTAFHAAIPPHAHLYAIPWELSHKWKIRRYGFHGISHDFVSSRYAEIARRPRKDLRLITAHLGNGCSMCAVRDGHAIDTTMGLTPLEGLVMGTRSGDIDASVAFRLMEWERLPPRELERLLNHESGLKGLSGVANDMRAIEAAASAGDERARLAIEIFCHRVRRYLGAYFAELNGADAVLFTGGIGENSALVRQLVCRELQVFGIHLDAAVNMACRGREACLSVEDSRTPVWVIPTNEELMIARETARVLRAPDSAGGGIGTRGPTPDIRTSG
jgi:acetate kinase